MRDKERERESWDWKDLKRFGSSGRRFVKRWYKKGVLDCVELTDY